MTNSADYSIAPVNLLDATTSNTDIVGHFSFVFRHQLSFEKLENSWQELVSAWPILAASVRTSNSAPSGLEYQIPSANKLEEIKVEQQLKEPNEHCFYCLDESSTHISIPFPAFDWNRCSSKDNSRIFTASACSPSEEKRLTSANALSTFTQYLEENHPILTVQITRFSHDTIICISLTHIFGDLFSTIQIMTAWQDILQGKGPPQALCNLGVDPFASFAPVADQEETSIPRGFHPYSLAQKLRLAAGYFYDLYIRRPEKTIEQRYIFIPRLEYESLKAQAKEDLQSMALREGRELNEEEFIGKSNILFAWLMKNSYIASSNKSKFCTLICVANCRGKEWFDKNTFSNNLFGAAFSIPLQPLQIQQLLEMSLGQLALHIRKSIKDKVNQADIAENISFSLSQNAWNSQNERKDFVFFGPPNHHFSGLSDWRAIKAFDLYFGPANLQDDSSSKEMAASRVWSMGVNMAMSLSKRDRWFVLGDSEHGTWLTGFMSSEQWLNLQGFGRFDQLSKEVQS